MITLHHGFFLEICVLIWTFYLFTIKLKKQFNKTEVNFNGPKQLFIITVIHLMLSKICYKTVVGNIVFYEINIINIISLDLIWWLTQHYMYHASTVLTTVCREMIFKLHVPDFTWKFSVEDCINKLLAV